MGLTNRLTNMPPEILSIIVKFIPQRRDLAAWQRTCKGTQQALRQYRDSLLERCKNRDELDLTQPETCPSSPETFRAWMIVELRQDDTIMEQGQRLFYSYYDENDENDEETEDEAEVGRRNARLVVCYIRDHIGNERLMRAFETSVLDGSSWATHVVMVFSEDIHLFSEISFRNDDDEEDDENGHDHELALNLSRAVLKMLKLHGQRLEMESSRRGIIYETRDLTRAQENLLLKTDYLAAAKLESSMLDDELAKKRPYDYEVRHRAMRCFDSYHLAFSWSIVDSVDEGGFAKSMLGTIERNSSSPHVQDWAERCFNLYVRFRMPVHAITFAQGMLEIPGAYGSNTTDSSSTWKKRRLSQERKRALWEKAGDLAQVMLRTYLEDGSLCESLPGSIQISQEKQLDDVAYDSQQPEFRLLKIPGPGKEIVRTAFPEKLPRGLLNDAGAQALILESVTRATQDANGTPIYGKTTIGELQSAIESWKSDKSRDAIDQNRKSTRPTYKL
jgi:hypothetical protein